MPPFNNSSWDPAHECLAIISPACRYRKLSITDQFSSAVPPFPLTSFTECPSSPSLPCPSRKRRFWSSRSGHPPLPNWTGRLLVEVFKSALVGREHSRATVGGFSHQQHSEGFPAGDLKMRDGSRTGKMPRSLSPEDKWGML